MAKGNLSEDTIKFIMTAESSELQQEIHKSGKVIDELKKKESDLRKEQVMVKSVLGEESKEYKDLQVKIKKVTQEIADENLKLTELHKRLGTSSMTMAQLRKEAKNLQRQLDNTSQSLNPQEYEAYASKLGEIKQRMAELKDTANGLAAQNKGGGFLSKLFGSKMDFGQLKTILSANAITKFAGIAMDAASRVASRVKDLVTESVNAAREAEGITRAFQRLDQPGLLDNLRKSTHGTVTDLELMKSAVQANDFRLPLDQLGKYLEFAQMKARDTGQSVDYLVNSIVTGLGRKSKMILDNLGISAAQLDEEMKKDGDMAKAVGRIIDEQMEAAGEHFETAAEREEQATVKVTNAQLELGNQMSKTFGIGKTSLSEMQAKAEVFILKGLTRLIIGCENLYNKLVTVRVAVQLVKGVFDTFFKAVEGGFYLIIDSIRIVIHSLTGVGTLIESIFESIATRSIDPIKKAWGSIAVNIDRDFSRMGNHMKSVGMQWGKNVIEGINAVTGKAKIETPKAVNELDEVVVTGTRRTKGEQSQKGGKTTKSTTATTARDTAEQDLKQYQQNLERLAVSGMNDAEKREHDLQQQLLLLKGYYESSLAYAQQHGEDTKAIDESYLKAREKLYSDYLSREEQERQRAEETEMRQQQQQQQAEERLRQKQLNEEEYTEQRKQQIRQQYGLASQQELYQMQLDQLKEYLDQELITTEEYEQAKKQLRIENLKEQFDYWSQMAGGAFSALQDAELETVRAKYDAEIDAARKAGKDTTALEEKKANEELKVQKKYADVNFAVKASQIIADTAVSIMKAYADLGPIAGSIAAALMGVTGAAQLAVAKAERDRVKNMTLKGATSSSAARVAIGREEGGYLDVTRQQDGRRYHAKYDPRRRGYVDQPTVIVGEGPMGQSKEWVASNAAVENPTIRPVIDAIDQAQRAGNVRTLDLQKVLLQQGRQQGGYLNGQRSVVNGQSSTANGQWSAVNDQRLMQRLTDVLERMEQEGIPALVGIDQVDAANELRNRSRRIAAK